MQYVGAAPNIYGETYGDRLEFHVHIFCFQRFGSWNRRDFEQYLWNGILLLLPWVFIEGVSEYFTTYHRPSLFGK